jgi:predicted NUDIX family NTP pyrophosphohydrolase
MDKKAKDESKETVKKPEQDVPEENKIAILGHNIFKEDDKSGGSNIVVELNIKNVIDKTVGSVVFEAEFSDRVQFVYCLPSVQSIHR